LSMIRSLSLVAASRQVAVQFAAVSLCTREGMGSYNL
jgi:hypothetical protein